MLKDLLTKKLTKRQLELVPSSFDIIGSREKAVAIIEIPNKLKCKEKTIANALMKQHKNIKTVIGKESPRKGIYRTRKMKIIKGIKNTEVVHNESGCRFLLDPRKVYFSPREGTERMRIAEKVKNKEIIMIFFAGAGPFAVVIGKKSKPKRIIGIEINPIAVKYFKENVVLNKLGNVEIIKGDVKKQAQKFYKKCDRVLMPLPESAENYLEEAINCIKKGIVHFYYFCEENKINEKKRRISSAARKLKRKIKIISINKVLPYGPRIWKYRIDFTVS
jgi:tRNA (guanine37-N1)-methyltransferase